MEHNREQIVKDLECIVDKYSENGSYYTYITLKNSLALIRELIEEKETANRYNALLFEENRKLYDDLVANCKEARVDTVMKMHEKWLTEFLPYTAYTRAEITAKLHKLQRELLGEVKR